MVQNNVSANPSVWGAEVAEDGGGWDGPDEPGDRGGHERGDERDRQARRGAAGALRRRVRGAVPGRLAVLAVELKKIFLFSIWVRRSVQRSSSGGVCCGGGREKKASFPGDGGGGVNGSRVVFRRNSPSGFRLFA